MRPPNERRRYIVTAFLIGWAHTQISMKENKEATSSTVTQGRISRLWTHDNSSFHKELKHRDISLKFPRATILQNR